jgi:hypothetical protein
MALAVFGPNWERVKEITVDSGTNNIDASDKAAKKMKGKYIGARAIQYQIPAQLPATASILIHFDDNGYLQDFSLSERKL